MNENKMKNDQISLKEAKDEEGATRMYKNEHKLLWILFSKVEKVFPEVVKKK